MIFGSVRYAGLDLCNSPGRASAATPEAGLRAGYSLGIPQYLMNPRVDGWRIDENC